MLKPQRNLVVALLLVAIGLGGAFLSARVFVTSMENRRLAEIPEDTSAGGIQHGIYDVFAPHKGAGRRAPPFAS
jgi:hypothetical protein